MISVMWKKNQCLMTMTLQQLKRKKQSSLSWKGFSLKKSKNEDDICSNKTSKRKLSKLVGEMLWTNSDNLQTLSTFNSNSYNSPHPTCSLPKNQCPQPMLSIFLIHLYLNLNQLHLKTSSFERLWAIKIQIRKYSLQFLVIIAFILTGFKKSTNE